MIIHKLTSLIKNTFILIFIILSKGIMTFIPKNNRLILFSSWLGQSYSDSSRYMFEYLLKNKLYDPVWYTINKSVYNNLKSQGIPVVYGKSLLGIFTQIRARMLVSSVQFSDFNKLFLRNCIFFDLDHGYVLKQVGLAIPGVNKKGLLFDKVLKSGIQFWMSAGSVFGMRVISECYGVNKNRIVRCNKPRLDVLFDESLQKGKNKIIEQIKKGRKAIVWMPTHRSEGHVPIEVSKIVDLNKLQKICERENIVFIIKKHFYHKNEIEDLTIFPNIFDVTHDEIDSQVILAQADALVSDYSSSYIEYLVLDRPILLFAYDKDEYLKHERGLYIPFDQNTAGERVYTSNSFLNSIDRICNDWYDSEYSEGRHEAKNIYFDDSFRGGHCREEVLNIINNLMKGTYTPEWK